MTVYSIDLWVDARSLGHDTAVKWTFDAVRGLAAGQVAEVMVTDVVAAADILAWPQSKPVEVLDSTVNRGACRLILRHR